MAEKKNTPPDETSTDPFRYLGVTVLAEGQDPPRRSDPPEACRVAGRALPGQADRTGQDKNPFRHLHRIGGDVGWPPLTSDSIDWDESEHPRDEDGKFTESGSGSRASAKPAPAGKAQKTRPFGGAQYVRVSGTVPRPSGLARPGQPQASGAASPGQGRPVKTASALNRGPGANQKLSRNKADYKQLGAKLEEEARRRGDTMDQAKKPYSNEAVRDVYKAREDIFKAAEYFQVSPEAVAACMLDERTATTAWHRRLLDTGQNVAASLMYPYPESYQSLKEHYEQQLSKQPWRPDTWDVGPYNINILYGFQIFQKIVLEADGDNPIKSIVMNGMSKPGLFPVTDNNLKAWNSFVENVLLDKKGGAYVAAYALQEGENVLSPYLPELKTAEERAALTIGAYKQGAHNMKRKYQKRFSQGDTSPMRIGDGARMIYNIDQVHAVLYTKSPPHHPNMEMPLH